MSKIALDHGATIDKYVGDAIIAFFGDPETRGVKEDARACVNMAITMQHRMRELQLEWLDMGLERPFEIRIGINTGFCTVGNFGSADRMDYTIIGNEGTSPPDSKRMPRSAASSWPMRPMRWSRAQ
jgi:class 3 adenylate cyclase